MCCTQKLLLISSRPDRVEYHFYAGDTQLYVTFKCDSMEDAYLGRTGVKCCVEDINSWMIKNKLKLNGAKTELMS